MKQRAIMPWILLGALLLAGSSACAATAQNARPGIEYLSNARLSEPAISEEEQYIAYLTFDDGPSLNTGLLLDKLDDYDVKATFFVVGERLHRYPLTADEIVRRGHTLGVHSYSHKYAEIYLSVDNFVTDLEKMEDTMPQGYAKVFRFPGGKQKAKRMASKLITALQQKGYTYYEWDIEVGDGLVKKPTQRFLHEHWQSAYKRNQANKRRKLIILLHDMAGKKASIDFLDTLIPQLKADGYAFGVLS